MKKKMYRGAVAVIGLIVGLVLFTGCEPEPEAFPVKYPPTDITFTTTTTTGSERELINVVENGVSLGFNTPISLEATGDADERGGLFTYTWEIVSNGLPEAPIVKFNDPAGNPVTGASFTGRSVQIQSYKVDGEATIKVTVTNRDGSYSVEFTVEVDSENPSNPVPTIITITKGSDEPVGEDGVTMGLDSDLSLSAATDPGLTDVTFKWVIEDGEDIISFESGADTAETQTVMIHSAADTSGGEFKITVRVDNEYGHHSIFFLVKVDPETPAIHLPTDITITPTGSPPIKEEGDITIDMASAGVLYTATSTVNPEGPQQVSYTWTIRSGASVSLSPASGSTPTVTITPTTTPGTTEIEVIATNTDGSASMTFKVHVLSYVITEVKVKTTTGPQTDLNDKTITIGTYSQKFVTEVTRADQSIPLTYAWSIESGNSSVKFRDNITNQEDAVITGIAAGTATIKVTVSNGKASPSATFTVTVSNDVLFGWDSGATKIPANTALTSSSSVPSGYPNVDFRTTGNGTIGATASGAFDLSATDKILMVGAESSGATTAAYSPDGKFNLSSGTFKLTIDYESESPSLTSSGWMRVAINSNQTSNGLAPVNPTYIAQFSDVAALKAGTVSGNVSGADSVDKRLILTFKAETLFGSILNTNATAINGYNSLEKAFVAIICPNVSAITVTGIKLERTLLHSGSSFGVTATVSGTGGGISVKNSISTAAEGSVVMVTATPNPGMLVDTITRTDTNAVLFTNTNNLTGPIAAGFIMPGSAITITAAFKAEPLPPNTEVLFAWDKSWNGVTPIPASIPLSNTANGDNPVFSGYVKSGTPNNTNIDFRSTQNGATVNPDGSITLALAPNANLVIGSVSNAVTAAAAGTHPGGNLKLDEATFQLTIGYTGFEQSTNWIFAVQINNNQTSNGLSVLGTRSRMIYYSNITSATALTVAAGSPTINNTNAISHTADPAAGTITITFTPSLIYPATGGPADLVDRGSLANAFISLWCPNNGSTLTFTSIKLEKLLD